MQINRTTSMTYSPIRVKTADTPIMCPSCSCALTRGKDNNNCYCRCHPNNVPQCQQCGKQLKYTKHQKSKYNTARFCCPKCRVKYWRIVNKMKVVREGGRVYNKRQQGVL